MRTTVRRIFTGDHEIIFAQRWVFLIVYCWQWHLTTINVESIFAFPLQQGLRESAAVSPYMYTDSLIHVLAYLHSRNLCGWSINVKNFSFLIQMYLCIHSLICLTTGPKPPPKRCLHIGRSRDFSFKWAYPLLSLRSSSSFLRLLPRLFATSISPFIFPSITCFRRQFLRKMCPIQLAFLFLISCRIFLCSLTLSMYVI